MNWAHSTKGLLSDRKEHLVREGFCKRLLTLGQDFASQLSKCLSVGTTHPRKLFTGWVCVGGYWWCRKLVGRVRLVELLTETYWLVDLFITCCMIWDCARLIGLKGKSNIERRLPFKLAFVSSRRWKQSGFDRGGHDGLDRGLEVKWDSDAW